METSANRASEIGSTGARAPESTQPVTPLPRTPPRGRRWWITRLVAPALAAGLGLGWWQVRLSPAAWIALLRSPPEMVRIPAGRFVMGASADDTTVLRDNERPAHEVVLDYAFEMARYEVTVAEYEVFAKAMGKASSTRSPTAPATGMSLDEAKAYAAWLSRATFRRYRLPSESEWEYAARAGTTARYVSGDRPEDLDRVAWYRDNADGRLHPVGEKEPNPWGLHDMLGNATEWVLDEYHDTYTGAPTDGSPRLDPASMTGQATRGGSSITPIEGMRVSYRRQYPAQNGALNVGFRLVREID